MRHLIIILAMSILSACATSTQPETSSLAPELRQVNVISITKEKVDFAKNKLFAWQTDLFVTGSEAKAVKPANIVNLKQQVQDYFNGKGYLFSDNLMNADYFLVGMVLLDGYEQSTEHSELLMGLDPGMHPSKEYGLGTLLIGVRDVKSGNLVWRGAVQIFLANDNDALSADVRKARVNHAIKMLMDGLFENTK